MIDGGYFIIARKLFESEIMDYPPLWRIFWVWMLGKAQHKGIIYKGRNILRGQLLTSYPELQDVGSYYAGYKKLKPPMHSIESCLKRMAKDGMITKTKTTRGLWIQIVKYDFYQNPSNYESQTETDTIHATKPQSSRTINKNEKNDEEGKKFNTGYRPENKTFEEKNTGPESIGSILSRMGGGDNDSL